MSISILNNRFNSFKHINNSDFYNTSSTKTSTDMEYMFLLLL